MSRLGAVLLVMICLLAYAGCLTRRQVTGPGLSQPPRPIPRSSMPRAFMTSNVPKRSVALDGACGVSTSQEQGKRCGSRSPATCRQTGFAASKMKIELNGETLDEFSGLTVEKEYTIPAAKQGNKEYWISG